MHGCILGWHSDSSLHCTAIHLPSCTSPTISPSECMHALSLCLHSLKSSIHHHSLLSLNAITSLLAPPPFHSFDHHHHHMHPCEAFPSLHCPLAADSPQSLRVNTRQSCAPPSSKSIPIPPFFFPKGLILKQGSSPTWVCCSWDLPWPGNLSWHWCAAFHGGSIPPQLTTCI